MYRWELLSVCHHSDESCNHGYYDSGGIIFLIEHVTSRKHMFKGLCEFMGENPSR